MGHPYFWHHVSTGTLSPADVKKVAQYFGDKLYEGGPKHAASDEAAVYVYVTIGFKGFKVGSVVQKDINWAVSRSPSCRWVYVLFQEFTKSLLIAR